MHQEADNKENSTNLGRDISIAVDKVEGVKLARAPKGATTMSERQALRPKVCGSCSLLIHCAIFFRNVSSTSRIHVRVDSGWNVGCHIW